MTLFLDVCEKHVTVFNLVRDISAGNLRAVTHFWRYIIKLIKDFIPLNKYFRQALYLVKHGLISLLQHIHIMKSTFLLFLFVQIAHYILRVSFWVEFIDAHREHFFDDAYTRTPDFKYHFMCLNNKCNYHRAYLLNKMFQEEIVWNRGNISVIEQDDRYDFPHPIILEENRSPELLEKFHEWEKLSDKQIANDIVSLGDPRHWRSHFVTVVTESCHHTDVFLSEKIFKPLIGMRPFLALGDANLYSKLREFGFDTFDDLFPNVGLYETNWEHRANNLMKDLRKICHTRLSDLDDVYDSIYTRLEHNRDNMISLIEKNKRWIQDLSKL